MIEAPPDDWRRVWAEYVNVYNIPWANLRDASDALEQFWVSVAIDNPRDSRWDPDQWGWVQIT